VKLLLFVVLCLVALAVVGFALAIALGGPHHPAPMKSINEPFAQVDFSDLPPTSFFTARDGTSLAYRAYMPPGVPSAGSVILVHGSAGNGASMHVLAKSFAAAGFSTYALDERGHGRSGPRGDIAYIGQLEDDLEDFVRATRPVEPATLVGFSSGGGFVLRFAGSSRQRLFSGYVLLSPFLGPEAPTQRAGSGGWVSVGLARYVAIATLHGWGIRLFDHLPVLRFAVVDDPRADLTPQYSFALAQNFRPEQDYLANIRAVQRPMAVVAGLEDEVFFTVKLPPVFQSHGTNVPVTLLPGVGHIGLTLDPVAVRAVVSAVRALYRDKPQNIALLQTKGDASGNPH